MSAVARFEHAPVPHLAAVPDPQPAGPEVTGVLVFVTEMARASVRRYVGATKWVKDPDGYMRVYGPGEQLRAEWAPGQWSGAEVEVPTDEG